jgi:hypothetical protein
MQKRSIEKKEKIIAVGFDLICKNGYCFINSEDTDEYLGTILGNHSGFSKDEMIIPLVVINNKK